MVLGAGLGTRMKPFTDVAPKTLLPLLGVPVMEFALLRLKEAGISRVVVNSHAHADQMERYCQSNPVEGLQIAISDERDQLLGSAGGFRHALTQLGDGSFLSINADTINLVVLQDLMARHQKLRAERKVSMTLALLNGEWLQAQTGHYRKIEVNETTGLINGYSDKLQKNTPFFCGVAVFEKEAFEHLPDGKPAEFVPEVLEPMIRKKKVGFMWTDTLWMDIGNPELWWRAHFDLYERYLNQALPGSWMKRIEASVGRYKISRKDHSIDYDFESVAHGAPPLGKNSIRLQNLTYAISNVGNL